jgi:hypothetical protein
MSLLASTSVDIRELISYPALQKLVTFPTQSEALNLPYSYRGPTWRVYGFISRPEAMCERCWERHKYVNMAEFRHRRNVEAPGKELKRGKEDGRGLVALILR